MVKKIIGIIFVVGVILIIVLSIREGITNNPRRILNRLIEKGGLAKSKGLVPKDLIFKEGEGLNFSVKYMWIIPMGDADIELKELMNYQGHKVYHLVAKVETSKFISKFFNASARVESYMDTQKLHSLRYKEETYIPDHEPEIKDITYDQKNLVMELRGVKRKILPDTQDPISALFYIRTQEFESGKAFTINIITKEENYELRAEVLKRDVVSTSSGEVGLWVVDSSVRRWDRSSHHGATFTIWFTDDERKLPILIKIKTKVGPVSARLVDVR